MKPTLDVNARTLEQEKRDLKQTSSIVRIEAVAFGVTLLCAFVINAIQYGKTDSPEICAVIKFISLPLDAVVIAIAVKFIISVFREIENSDTPFRYSVADKLKGLANAVIIGSSVIALPHIIIVFIEAFAVEDSSPDYSYSVILLGGLFFGVFLSALARVFAIGCKLQQESDETL